MLEVLEKGDLSFWPLHVMRWKTTFQQLSKGATKNEDSRKNLTYNAPIQKMHHFSEQ